MATIAPPATELPPANRHRPGPVRLMRRRSVQLAIVGWVTANALLLGLAGGHLPFHAASLAHPPTVDAVLDVNAVFVEVFALMAVVHLLTQRRDTPNIAARAPARDVARTETLLVLAYGAAALLGGFLLGKTFGWHAFGFHLEGMVIDTPDDVQPAEMICWSVYNVVAYVVVPLLVFRRRYSTEALNLRSSNRRNDLLVVVVVLALEATFQLLLNSAILDLDARQVLLGAPLTLVLSLAGTVLPAMVFIYCILIPRYLVLTDSVPATIVLGGLTYALLHVFDGWITFASPTDAAMSMSYLLLFYSAPGMFKTFLTLRTGNAWVHVWAYHAIGPHTLLDTPMTVKVFGIR